MEKTWMPTVAAILEIISGPLILLFAFVSVMFFMWPDPSMYPIFASITIVSVIAGVLAIVGGINAIRRRNWGWALTGSIAILSPLVPLMTWAVVENNTFDTIFLSLFVFPFLLLGIPAIVLIARSKKEFGLKRS